MAEAEAVQAAVEPVGTYVAIKKQIAKLEIEADAARDEVKAVLRTDDAPVGKSWEFPGIGSVLIAKGRVTTRIDPTRLAKAGVAKEVIEAATITTEGQPSVRIAADLED